jgi:hypothetical protein
MGADKLEFQLKKVPGAGMETFQHLEDGGWIERVSIGDSHRYRVLVFCSCGGGHPPSPEVALRRESRLRLDEPPLAVGGSDAWLVSSVGVSPGGMEGSVQKPTSTVSLAKFFFPEVVRRAGIQMTPLHTNGPALAHHLNRWKLQGINLNTMGLMMEEFARHPEWCQRSRKPPWRIFIAKHDELVSLVTHRQGNDPSNRRWDGIDWLSCRTPRVNYAT